MSIASLAVALLSIGESQPSNSPILIAHADTNTSCEYVYNQSGFYICLPQVNVVSGVCASISFTPNTSTTLVIDIRVVGLCPVTINLYNSTGYLFYNYTTTLNTSTTLAVDTSTSVSDNIVVFRVDIGGFEAWGHVRMPAMIVPEYLGNLHPAVKFLLLLLPVAPVLSFLVRGDLRSGAIASLLSLPFIYVIASYLSISPSIVVTVLSVSLVASLIAYLIGSSS